MVRVPGAVVRRYERFSLYNSPYPAHDHGRAIDLYPGHDTARSPVAGEVLERRAVRCPPKDYAVAEDHLLLVDCGDVVARILHVEPSVQPGEVVDVGDELGTLVRSGFFGRWVDNHIHLGFRRRDQNLRRASGSLPLELDLSVVGVPWDGTGEVIEVGPTHVLLDAPDHPGGGFAAIASDEGVPLDGGLVHYAGGGVLGSDVGVPGGGDGEEGESGNGEENWDGEGNGDHGSRHLSLLGTPIGTVDRRDLTWRDVTWRDVAVHADGVRATGLSLFASQVPFGAKVVFHEGHDFAVGDQVQVAIEPTDESIRLG